jgi:hypothetical protein
LLAECQIEIGGAELANALVNINKVRNRAANPDGFVSGAAATYSIIPYGSLGTQAEARIKLQMERKLELGMEGHRYFDLQRWGNLVAELNRVLTFEKTVRSTLYGSTSVGTEDVNYPIPQNQIDITQGKLKQNR